MGNHICGNEDKKQAVVDSKIVISQKFGDMEIQVIQADIVEEMADVIVNASHEPVDSYIAKREKNPKLREQLQSLRVGEMIITNSLNLNCSEIIHVKLPLYQEPKDLQKIYYCFQQVLKRCDSRTISFTEQANSLQIPRQYMAETLMRALVSCENSNIQIIKFVSTDLLVLRYYGFELSRRYDELKIPYLAKSRLESFLSYVNEENKQECYGLSTGLTDDV